MRLHETPGALAVECLHGTGDVVVSLSGQTSMLGKVRLVFLYTSISKPF